MTTEAVPETICRFAFLQDTRKSFENRLFTEFFKKFPHFFEQPRVRIRRKIVLYRAYAVSKKKAPHAKCVTRLLSGALDWIRTSGL